MASNVELSKCHGKLLFTHTDTYSDVVKFLESCIERTPDMYLLELRQELWENVGVKVAECMIAWTLRR
jgi:hypothetical protein